MNNNVIVVEDKETCKPLSSWTEGVAGYIVKIGEMVVYIPKTDEGREMLKQAENVLSQILTDLDSPCTSA